MHCGTLASGTLFALAYAILAPACGGTPTNSGFGGENTVADSDAGLFDEAGDPIFSDGGTASKPGCTGLQCQQVTCPAGQDTTVTGTAFAPNGTLALYDVIAYVPNAALAPMAQGASCDQCAGQVSGNPVVTSLSDSKGNFVLENVPVGTNIPLVLQVGKWRRQVVIPEVKACVETKLADPNLTRLPKNQGEGDLPKIALTTGSADPLGCILPKMGIDASEFSQGPGGKARVNVYEGNGGTHAPNATPFWSDANQLKAYDLVILSCEGDENLQTKPAAARSAMEAYTNMGGRIFGSHYHYVWFQYGSANFQGTAQWEGDGTADDSGGPYKVDTSFPKGLAFADWLVAVGASTTPGQVGLNDTKADVGTVNVPSQRWITDSSLSSTKYLSFNTPVGAAPSAQCGKAVFGDMHIGVSSGGSASVVDDSFPAGCSSSLSPQEKALAFLFFDLSSCIQPEGAPPVPPAPK
ncbi:MAG: carboxypeptidase regulatory-like domain-containing protein [Polyangiaceae bacterium]